MNMTLTNHKCNVVSIRNAKNAETERRLLEDNKKCHLLAIDDKNVHNDSEKVHQLSLTERTGSEASDEERMMSLIKTKMAIVDLLIIGSKTNSYEYAKMFLTEAAESNAVIVCQVNLLYHEPRNADIPKFFEVVRSLTHSMRYVLMRADRDRQSLNMQLFFVNHQDQYCSDRYLRMYTFD
ncbi:hypothetical protein DICVIV_01075 [Dictyocaulus viviparus]|uniref:Uncharacterized protein n=1 Tax=Dictyocaulus viviparus TaxID=29172 RepID=A0A0D8YDQ5_DICVI|nr:hypothetical protein DICVIV_01075 [Dictyocaulus viviparus]